MRLARLDLVRYGRFTDASLDFGPAPGEGPDLHIVYGPNEAGKSTLLNAWLDLLYGIETRSRYDFLHPKPTMRIAARVETGGDAHELIRIKRRSATLIGPDGGARDEGVLAGALSGVSREAYRAMFSLDDDSIEAGGEAILRSEGALGELLFAASAGRAELGARLADLRGEADAFHRPNARKTELARLRSEIEALRAERREIDVTAPEQARLMRAEAEARSAETAALAARAAADERLAAARRRQAALAPRERLARARAQHAALAPRPPSPEGWAQTLQRLTRAETALATRRETLTARRAALDEALAAIPRDPEILEEAAAIDALAGEGGPGARFATAEEDLPNRRAERDALTREIAALMARLEAPADAAPEEVVLSGPRLARLRALLEQHSGIEAERRAAREEAEAARTALARVEAGEADAPPPAEAIEALKAARAAAAGGEHPGRAEAARAEVARLEHGMADRCAALAPWDGAPEALSRLSVPSQGRRAAWVADLDAVRRAEAQAREALARASAARAEAETRRAAGEARLAGASEAEAAEARRARDAAWASHRAALDAGTADAFAGAMAEDDRISAARLARAGELAALAERAEGEALARRAEEAAATELEAATARRTRIERDIAAAIAAMAAPGAPAPPVTEPAALEDWLAVRAAALETLAARDAAERTRAEADAAAGALAARLAEALAALGRRVETARGLPALMAEADAALAAGEWALSRAEARARERERLQQAAETREQRRAAAEAAAEAWAGELAEALSGTWLAERADTLRVTELGQILEDQGTLEARLAERRGLEARIAKMERDRARYRAALAAVAGRLGAPVPEGQEGAVAARLASRLAAARAAEARHAEKLAERDETARALTALEAEIAEHESEARALLTEGGAESLSELHRHFEEGEARARLAARIAEERAALAEALGEADPDAAEAALDRLARADIEAELHAAEAERAALDSELSERVAARVRAADALAGVGADARVAEIEQRLATTGAAVAEGARRHLALRLGLRAVERALALYRERHRSAMLADAARAFALITEGAYEGLSAEPGEGGEERIVARRAGGGALLSSALSKGTRFQLYLALRVAGHHAFGAHREALPFVADDILETFDDARARAALALMAEMARAGQVICLTHHRHLCDLAREACPGARFHSLPGAPEPG